ncbi:hypothetical protein TELCIR_23889 [Teladorsagia circumcincta]|uniref:Uncharacterized protein n=1 Tax=Teladorsagia circumcincta TaxID=45464 RepID=A0A2G9TBH4_TELCI|nr:hypothetical protein TELCIR_23889 [Teladorsagia circumcincta]
MKGPVYYELLHAGNTVTAAVYIGQLQHLVDAVREKRARRSTVYLQHDNTRTWLAPGCSTAVLSGPCTLRLPLVPATQAPPARKRVQNL